MKIGPSLYCTLVLFGVAVLGCSEGIFHEGWVYPATYGWVYPATYMYVTQRGKTEVSLDIFIVQRINW